MEWFASWFDSPHYRRLYAHRDEMEAARFLDGLVAQLRPRPDALALDLGCGTGRHSKYLASKGFQVTGLDLSASSIEQAKQLRRQCLQFRQHDMRVPFGREAFDYVFNFFTSFGYFEDASEHTAVVQNIAASLKPGGRLVLDYLNAGFVASHLQSEQETQFGSTTYQLKRWTDGRRFFKRILASNDAGESHEYVERVARFGVDDFQRMFAAHDLRIERVYGDYGLFSYDPAISPRLILVARKDAMGVAAA